MKHKKTERGQAIVLIALAIVGLVGMTGLAIDGGNAFANKRQAQNAADNAALSTALLAIRDEDATQAELEANADDIMRANGFDSDDGSVTITVNRPPADGPYASCTNPSQDVLDEYPDFDCNEFIQVIIDTDVETFFASAVGVQSTHSRVETVARAKQGTTSPLYGGNAIVALKDTGNNTFDILGGNMTNIKGSGIFVNSSGSKAFRILGGCIMNTDTGIGVVGGTQLTPSVMIDGYMVAWNAKNPPTLSTGVAPISLPPDYSFIPMPPAPPSCAGLPTITKNSWNNYPDGANITLTPGNYVNGITILGGVTHITMGSGTYCVHDHFQMNGGMVLDGGNVKLVPQGNYDVTINGGTILNFDNLEYYTEDGGLIINGGNQLHADRFRFYATGAADFNMQGGSVFTSNNAYFYLPEGKAQWLGGSIISMSAPPQNDPDGFGGLLMYKPWENEVDETFYGGNSITLNGSILMPHTDLKFIGGTSTNAVDTQIIAYTVQFMGGSFVNIDFNDNEQYQAGEPPVIELAQ